MPNYDRIPPRLEPKSYDTVYDLMVTQPAPYDPDYAVPVESSFTGVMAYLRQFNPDVFLFTHKSAIPIADSVRGYYEELGLAIPELGVVNTKEKDRTRELDFTNPHFIKRRWDNISPEVIQRELKALRPVVDGKKVAVIDQLTATRGTLKRANVLVGKAGASAVILPYEANWYDEALDDDVNVTELTSVHAEHMRKIGHTAAQFELPENWVIPFTTQPPR